MVLLKKSSRKKKKKTTSNDLDPLWSFVYIIYYYYKSLTLFFMNTKYTKMIQRR